MLENQFHVWLSSDSQCISVRPTQVLLCRQILFFRAMQALSLDSPIFCDLTRRLLQPPVAVNNINSLICNRKNTPASAYFRSIWENQRLRNPQRGPTLFPCSVLSWDASSVPELYLEIEIACSHSRTFRRRGAPSSFPYGDPGLFGCSLYGSAHGPFTFGLIKHSLSIQYPC